MEVKAPFIRFILPFLLAVAPSSLEASKNADALDRKGREAKEDTTRIDALNQAGRGLMRSNPDSAIELSTRALQLAKKIEDPERIARSHINLGIYHSIKSDFPEALEAYFKALEIFKGAGNKKGMARCYGNIGIIHYQQSSYPQALEHCLNALEIEKELKDSSAMAGSYNNIGGIYQKQKEHAKALEYYQKSLKIKKKEQDTVGMAHSYSNIGLIHRKQGNYSKALEQHLRSLEIERALAQKGGTATSYNNLGTLLMEVSEKPDSIGRKAMEKLEGLGEWEGEGPSSSGNIDHWLLLQAERYQEKARKIQKEMSDEHSMFSSQLSLGKIAMKKGNPSKALSFYQDCFRIATRIGALEHRKDAALALSEAYEELGQIDSALEYRKTFSKIKDRIFNKKKQKELGRQESRFEWKQKLLKKEEAEKRQRIKAEKAELKAEKAQEEQWRQQILTYSVSGGLILVLSFLGLLYNRFRIARHQKGIIEEQKRAVDEAYDQLHEKNREITDSIDYAKLIQKAVLTTEEELRAVLGEHFILFKPHSVVSGDFYWAWESPEGDKFWLAADCTGHGVPGAFMSMICTSLMEEMIIEKGMRDPGKILTAIKESLTQKLGDSQRKDGMDAALCRYHPEEQTLWFAGANNPLYIVRQGIGEEPDFLDRVELLGKTSENTGKDRINAFKNSKDGLEIKGDNIAVALEDRKENRSFNTVKVPVQEGDLLYSFSDGFADQFGGKKGKKFRYAPFKQLLVSLSGHAMEEQKRELDRNFEEWKEEGQQEQIDDVVVIGVRL